MCLILVDCASRYVIHFHIPLCGCVWFAILFVDVDMCVVISYIMLCVDIYIYIYIYFDNTNRILRIFLLCYWWFRLVLYELVLIRVDLFKIVYLLYFFYMCKELGGSHNFSNIHIYTYIYICVYIYIYIGVYIYIYMFGDIFDFRINCMMFVMYWMLLYLHLLVNFYCVLYQFCKFGWINFIDLNFICPPRWWCNHQMLQQIFIFVYNVWECCGNIWCH